MMPISKGSHQGTLGSNLRPPGAQGEGQPCGRGQAWAFQGPRPSGVAVFCSMDAQQSCSHNYSGLGADPSDRGLSPQLCQLRPLDQVRTDCLCLFVCFTVWGSFQGTWDCTASSEGELPRGCRGPRVQVRSHTRAGPPLPALCTPPPAGAPQNEERWLV